MTIPTNGDVDGVLVSEYETFARLPEWVLDADISAQAVRLFAVLLRHADKGGKAFPSRARIAARMHCSTDTVDRAMKQLTALGAVEVRRNGTGTEGDPYRPNTYLLKRAPGRSDAATPSRTGAARVAASVRNEREPVNESQNPPAPSEQAPPKAKRASTGKHPLPEDWAPTDALRAWAAENAPLVDVDTVTPIFVAHFLGTGAQHKRWDMSWQRWMRVEQERLSRSEARRNTGTTERHAMLARQAERARLSESGEYVNPFAPTSQPALEA